MLVLRKRIAVIALAAGMLLGSACTRAVPPPPPPPPVATQSGLAQGVADQGVESFKGLPYAAPPVGGLRWRPPQPPAAWTGVRTATRYGADCFQAPISYDSAPLRTAVSEDCLYLNVWRPAGVRAGRKTPVVVWIHGGGFSNGGASPAVFAGDGFARKGVILVSLNYRLGRFGFFGFPALSREDGGRAPLGNYGLMDQVAALQWVKRNIAAFGGDPANVTVMGESAGGISINLLLGSPLAKDLFTRAIIQSGEGRDVPGELRDFKVDKPGYPSTETMGVTFARRHGIAGTDAKALDALRALPAAAILDGLSIANSYKPEEMAAFAGPMVDGRLVVATPQQTYLANHNARVPVIVGATNFDFGYENTSTKAGLFAQFGANAGRAQALYDPTGKVSADMVIATASADWTMVEPARFVATAFARQGAPAYPYRFAYVAKSMRKAWPEGAPHASDVPYAMNTIAAVLGGKLDRRDARLADAMNSYWVNFARTGNPNGPGLPPWPAYNPAADMLMTFAADGKPKVVKDPWKARLDLVGQLH